MKIYIIVSEKEILGNLNVDTGEISIKKGIKVEWNMTSNSKVQKSILNHLKNYENLDFIKTKIKGDLYKIELLKDIIFPTPTTASNILSGSSKNGWLKWRIKQTGELIKSLKSNTKPRTKKKKITFTKADELQNKKIAELEKKINNSSLENKLTKKLKYEYTKIFRFNKDQIEKINKWSKTKNVSEIIRKLIDEAPE